MERSADASQGVVAEGCRLSVLPAVQQLTAVDELACRVHDGCNCTASVICSAPTSQKDAVSWSYQAAPVAARSPKNVRCIWINQNKLKAHCNNSRLERKKERKKEARKYDDEKKKKEKTKDKKISVIFIKSVYF